MSLIYIAIAIVAGPIMLVGALAAVTPNKHKLKPVDCTIAELPQHRLGRVKGTVRPVGPPLTAPYSRRVCVHYEVFVWHDYADGEGYSETVETKDSEFELVDATGTAILDSGGKDLARDGIRVRLDDGAEIQPGRTLGYDDQLWESVVPVDAALTIVGVGVEEPDPRAVSSPRGTTPTRVRIALRRQ